jgi:spore maturation protein B
VIRAALETVSLWAIPVLLVVIPLAGLIRQVKVYDVFIEGAKEGFEVGVKIIPFLVGILVAIGMFRGSGAMELLTSALRPLASATGFPAELVPLAILRSLTGSGSLAFTTDFGAVGVRRTRHAVPAALVGDVVAAIAAVAVCAWMF